MCAFVHLLFLSRRWPIEFVLIWIMVCQYILSGRGFGPLKHHDSRESLIIISKITMRRAAVAVLCIGIWSLYISISRAFYTE